MDDRIALVNLDGDGRQTPVETTMEISETELSELENMKHMLHNKVMERKKSELMHDIEEIAIELKEHQGAQSDDTKVPVYTQHDKPVTHTTTDKPITISTQDPGGNNTSSTGLVPADVIIPNMFLKDDNTGTSPLTTTKIKYGNGYTAKKSLSTGLLDFSLITMNITQLKMLITVGSGGFQHFWPTIVFISLSLLVESAIAFITVYVGFLKAKTTEEKAKAKKINDVCLYLVSAATMINVVKSGFGLTLTTTGTV